MIFINLEKTMVKYQEISYGGHLKIKEFQYIFIIIDMYIHIVTSVRIYDDESNIFSIKIKLHQRPAIYFHLSFG
jgi:hypothetical protein